MSRAIKISLSTIGFLLLLVIASSEIAVSASLDWGCFDAAGSTSFGIYDEDDATVLQTTNSDAVIIKVSRYSLFLPLVEP